MPETMSKQTKRKITVEPTMNKNKDSQRRPSVFERLGTKATTTANTSQTNNDTFCRHWAQNGNCPYGKTCKYANTHTLISPSKQRAAKKDGDVIKPKQGHGPNPKLNSKDELNKRLHSTVVVKKTHSPDLNWENWDQTNLEYEDEKVLEKRRQLLQRELELQMKREKEEQQRQKKDKKSKKGISSSSSTSASSSSSTESSSSSDDSSSTSSSTSGDSRRRKKGKKLKRDSSSSTSETDRVSKKKTGRSGKGSVKSGGSPPPTKKQSLVRRDEQRKRRDPSPPSRKAPPPSSKPGQPPPRRRSLTPAGRSSSGHRRRSQTPPHSGGNKGKTVTTARSSLNVKQQSGVKHQSPRPNRSLSLDRKEKHNRSVSPRPAMRDRDRDRDKNKDRERDRDKDKEREREREKEKEREKEREKEKEKERERMKERDREKERDRGRSRSPKGKGKDRLSHSPRRDSRPPKDIRKKDSPDSGNSKDKGYRVSPAKSRSSVGGGRGRDGSLDNKRNLGKNSPRESERRDPPRSDMRDSRDSWGKHGDTRKDHDRGREKDDRDNRRDMSDRGVRDGLGKDRGSRETTMERSNGGRVGKDDGRKRDSQMLPGIVEKTAQDRDFLPKGRDHNDGDRDRDRDRDRGRDPRDNLRDSRDAKDNRDNLDPRLFRDARSREAAREKEREEALERCRERQREREREKELNKSREHERELPSLLSIMTHNPATLQQPPPRSNRDINNKSSADFHVGQKSLDKIMDRGPDRDRGLDRGPERDRGLNRSIERPGDRDRDRGMPRGLGRGSDRPDSRLDRPPERNFERSSERTFDRGPDRGFERGPHLDRENRDTHSERDYPLPPRNRDADVRRAQPDDKGYDSPFESRRGREERSRYSDQIERERNRYEEPTPQREDPRALVDRRMGVDPRNFSDDRRGRREGHNNMEPMRSRDPWEGRERERERDPRERETRDREREREIHERELREREQERRRGYEREEPRPPGPAIKGRDWETRDYTDSRREWDGRGRRGPPPDWEGGHRSEWSEKEVTLPIPHAIPPMEGEWGRFPGPGGDWAPPGGDRRGGWEEWGDRPGMSLGPPISMGGPPPGRPPPRMMLPHREEPPIAMLPRDVKMDESALEDGGKKLHDYLKDKDAVLDIKEDKLDGVKLEESSMKKPGDASDICLGSKRLRDISDNEPDNKLEVKKICLEEALPLEEDLSDISDDDADEILNREDSVEELTVPGDGNDVSLVLPHGTSEGPGTPLYHEHSEMTGTQLAGETSAPIPVSLVGSRDVLMRDADRESEERLSTSGVQEMNIESRAMLISSRIEERQQDDETMDNLDFEEISDEELESEEAKTGIGDALGVDWASLVAESRPRTRPDSTPGSARRRWESHRVLARLGVSIRYGGWDLVEDLKNKFKGVKEEDKETDEGKENTTPEPPNETSTQETTSLTFLHPVASIHVALRDRQARRKALFANSGPYKRALSARRDLAIRRQLCNLPVKETTGDTQHTGPDIEIYRLGVQLFERSL